MRRVNLTLPFYYPDWVYRIWKTVKHDADPPDVGGIINLLGDRDIEWSWIASQLPSGSGEALDFGNGGSALGLMAAIKGFKVVAVDLAKVEWPYQHKQLRFVQGDILTLNLPSHFYDLVINCSTIEHVGLLGRYGVTDELPDGDLSAMARLCKLMKTDGIMLLTIPVGKDAVFHPLCRVYGESRLPLLLEGFVVEKEVFWVKDEKNRWRLCDRIHALQFDSAVGSWNPRENITALGCFVLKKP